MPVLFWAEDVLLVAVGTGLKLHTDIGPKCPSCSVVSRTRSSMCLEALLEFSTTHSRSHLRIDLLSLVAFIRATLITRMNTSFDKSRFVPPETAKAEKYSDYFMCRTAISEILSIGSQHRRNGNIITDDLKAVVEKLHLRCCHNGASEISEGEGIYATSPEFSDVIVSFSSSGEQIPRGELQQFLPQVTFSESKPSAAMRSSWLG